MSLLGPILNYTLLWVLQARRTAVLMGYSDVALKPASLPIVWRESRHCFWLFVFGEVRNSSLTGGWLQKCAAALYPAEPVPQGCV